MRAIREAKLAKDIPRLQPFICDVSEELNHYYNEGKTILIEGTQGFGLSVYHSPYYPYTTSRDTTAPAFLSEVGISPLIVNDIIMVIRTFPIRVGGNSGPLPKEINWKTIQKESGYTHEIKELTSVTKQLRRVARFDLEIVKKAVSANRPTHLALMGTDYLEYRNFQVTNFDELTQKTKDFISWLETELNVKIDFIGTGPMDEEIIDRTINKGIEIFEK